jgi:medium-chain acyl-[acyl-carrier-protein] hydrolase
VKLRIFCFPPSGGGPGAFKGWQKMMPPGIELILVQLPGREQRSDEPLVSEPALLVNPIFEEIKNLVDLPYLIFGHSMGAFLGAEVARKIQEANLPLPKHLILSGYPPLYSNEERTDLMLKMLELSDDEFIRILATTTGEIPDSILNNPTSRRLLIDIVRADFRFLSYKYDWGGKFIEPITSIHAKDDKAVSKDEVLLWEKMAGSLYDSRSVEGAHLSLLNNPTPYVEIISSLVIKYLPSQDTN